MIKLSKYRAYSQKKKTTYSTRCIGRIIVWKNGEISDRYIGHLAIYDDESVRCSGKYSDTEKDIRKAQEELDCFADNHSYKYQGQNTELPTYEYYRYGGGYFRV